MLIQPNLLNYKAQNVASRVFVCGPGLSSGRIDIRNMAREHLESLPNVEAIYGEEIESKYSYKNRNTDLQTLEASFAHDVDFTLLILESPGSIAELGTFTQLRDIRDRLVVLVPNSFFRAESYIARGPLSLLAKRNPQNVIYFDSSRKEEMLDHVSYPVAFYKYAHFVLGTDYIAKTRISRKKPSINSSYSKYMDGVRQSYQKAITLIGVLVGERPTYSELLLLTGLGSTALNESLHQLFLEKKIHKESAATYRTVNGFDDEILKPFSTTAISKARSRKIATA